MELASALIQGPVSWVCLRTVSSGWLWQPDGWGYVPTLLVVCPGGDPVLEPAGYCVGLGVKTQPPGAPMPMFILRVSTPVLPSQWAIANACLPSRPSKTHRKVWSSYGVTGLPWVPVHVNTWFAVEFLLSSVLWGSCTQALCWPSKPNALGVLLPMPHSWVGEPDVGLRALTIVGKAMWYNFPVSGSPTQHVWDLNYIVKASLLPSHCGFFFVFVCRIALLESLSSFLIDSCSAVSCNVGVFLRGGEFKPTPPSYCSRSPESQHMIQWPIYLLEDLGPSLGFLFTFPFWPWVSNFISLWASLQS